MAITVSGTTITFPDTTTQTTAGKSGTVTSVATGNGLSGGTITTTGTLVVAAPSFNTVGSYGFGYTYLYGTVTSGSNYSAGSGVLQFTLGYGGAGNVLSGTWKWLGYTQSWTCDPGGVPVSGLICRVS
jgi:hypothetical protein